MIVRFEPVDNFCGWQKAPDFFKQILAENGCQHILEVGSGANPTLEPDYVREKSLRYVTSDLDRNELEKTDAAFERLVADISEEIDPALIGSFDCVFSRMVGEHIRDGEKYHRNIFKVLRPGGIAVHCFSTLWTVPFAMNRMLPGWLSHMLWKHYAPRDEHNHGKFKAHYSWSRGPTNSMIQRFQSLGYQIEEYIGDFGHLYYINRLHLLHRLERIKMTYLLRHPLPQLCSYSTVILRKPE